MNDHNYCTWQKIYNYTQLKWLCGTPQCMVLSLHLLFFWFTQVIRCPIFCFDNSFPVYMHVYIVRYSTAESCKMAHMAIVHE